MRKCALVELLIVLFIVVLAVLYTMGFVLSIKEKAENARYNVEAVLNSEISVDDYIEALEKYKR